MTQATTHPSKAAAVWPLLKQSATQWSDDKVPKLAAALSYYMAISIAPLLVLAVKVIALRYGADAAGDRLKGPLEKLTDPKVASILQDIVRQAGKPGAGTVAALLSIAVALFGASSVFLELQDSLNMIWKVKPKPGRALMTLLHDRSVSILIVIGVAVLLAASIVADTIISSSSNFILAHTVGSTGRLAHWATFGTAYVLGTVVIAIMFAALFRWLPDVNIGWKDVAWGAIVTSVLFQIGKIGLGLYLGKASPGSAYGAAGSLVVLIVWVWYSSLIFYFGAEFTRAFGDRYGSKIVPSENAEWIGDCNPFESSTPSSSGTKGTVMKTPTPENAQRVSTARAEFLRQQRYLQGVVQHRTAKPARGNPVFPVVATVAAGSGLVLGRLVYKHVKKSDNSPQGLRDKWIAALEKWRTAAKVLTTKPAERYAQTHGPEGKNGPSWADIAAEKRA